MKALAILLVPAIAFADPDLTVKHEPITSMRMRPRRTAANEPTPAASTTKPAVVATPPAALPITRSADDGGAGAVRDIQQPVSFSINVGYQVEATALTSKPTIGGIEATKCFDPNNPTDCPPSFTRLRSYGFGEGFLSTRGVGIANLSTYFAARFQASRDLQSIQGVERPSPIATWFERSGLELRTGWAEMKDFLPERYGFKGLRVRGGDQFIYGPWIMHLDGILAAWESKLIKFQAYGGFRHADYTRDVATDRPGILGGSARIDLRDLTNPIPIALAVEALNVGPDASTDARGSRNLQIEADWRPAQDFALIGKIRQLDGNTANERLEFRGRYRQVSNLVFDLIHRRRTDWQWDPALGRTDPDDTTMTARRYLDLGPVLPQLVASVRGGTLVAENLDLSLRGALATDLSDEKQDAPSSFNASYLEGAAALQVRLRRTVSVDASILTRQNNLPTPVLITDGHAPIPAADPLNCDMSTTPGGPTACQALPGEGTTGELGFTEVGAALRMSLGARRFSAAVELFGRKTRYQVLYAGEDPDFQSDVRGGGRFTIDAWVGDRVRLFAAYDISSRFEFAPEISGYKSLRLIMSGTY